jgi:pimeloyl-ACP methyl ester carboxylesterase
MMFDVATLDLNIRDVSYHVLKWLPTSWNGVSVLLIHGSKDRGTSFDDVAPILAATGYMVYAPDMRGHGATASGLSSGGYPVEHFVADIAELVEAVSPEEPVVLVGHSIGGIMATLYAGVFRERVRALILLEGLGFAYPVDEAADRLRLWIESTRSDRMRPPRRITKDHAVRSLASWNPEATELVIRRRADQLTVDCVDEDGLVWWFDPMLWRPLWELSFERWHAHASRVSAPTLSVSGGVTGHHPDDERERIAAFKNIQPIEIVGAGHMVHWTAPQRVAQEILAFSQPLLTHIRPL